MTKDTNGPGPELIVLGRGEAGKPQAARFPAGHNDLVTKAAKAMNLTVCKAESADVAELAKKLPTGRLYSTGRGFVPAVGQSLHGKLSSNSSSPVSRCQASPTSPMANSQAQLRLPQACRPPGTTLRSATW